MCKNWMSVKVCGSVFVKEREPKLEVSKMGEAGAGVVL